MIYINHRVNDLEELKKVPLSNGIELDLRYHENELILHHDPFHHHETSPTKFETLLKQWKHNGPIILNVKTEGIEQICIDLMVKYKIENWFFLDLSMPYFVLFSEHAADGSIQGLTPENLAVRFSEHEPVEYALSFEGKARWVWVDCFTYLPMTKNIYTLLKKENFKICLVSPELQKLPMAQINIFRKQIEEFKIDAICTKRPDLWGQDLPSDFIKQLEQDYPFE